MPENHQVVGKYTKTDLAGLAMMVSGTKGTAHIAFEHTEDHFDLPALAI